jgi:GDP-D-mannose 3', 5'-epimerase
MKALVLGGGGFIGSHMVRRLKSEGYWVKSVDLKYPEFSKSEADEFVIGDLKSPSFVNELTKTCSFDEVYQFAADMGGAGYIFTKEHDADVMHNSVAINLNVLDSTKGQNCKIFYSSSACIYPEHNQSDPDNPNCSEESAYPANPDSEYGWEKLFSERLYFAYNRNYGTSVRVARFHNIYGPEGTWRGGREKAPAAICRKVAESEGEIEIWGDGKQTRSFLFIDDCIEAVRRLMNSDFMGPINIGSEEMVTIDKLVKVTAKAAKKEIKVRHIPGPTGVRGRNSDNYLIRSKLEWDYSTPLEDGIAKTYEWICKQLKQV